MTFRNSQHPDTSIELWDGIRYVATIYTTIAGVHIVCEPGTDARLSITREDPPSINVELDDAGQAAPDARD